LFPLSFLFGDYCIINYFLPCDCIVANCAFDFAIWVMLAPLDNFRHVVAYSDHLPRLSFVIDPVRPAGL